MKKKDNHNLREVLMSIFVGACVAFLTTLFDSLADFIRANGEQIASGLISTAYYAARNVKIG